MRGVLCAVIRSASWRNYFCCSSLSSSYRSKLKAQSALRSCISCAHYFGINIMSGWTIQLCTKHFNQFFIKHSLLTNRLLSKNPDTLWFLHHQSCNRSLSHHVGRINIIRIGAFVSPYVWSSICGAKSIPIFVVLKASNSRGLKTKLSILFWAFKIVFC